MPLNAQVMLSILAHETSAGDLSRTLRATPASYALSLTDGTGANQAQVAWSDSRTIAASQTEDIDLKALVDDRGTVSLTSVKAIYIRNPGAVGIVWAGGGWGAAPLDDAESGRLHIRSGGVLFLADASAGGWGVPAGGGQTISIENASAAAPASYEVVLIGEGTVT